MKTFTTIGDEHWYPSKTIEDKWYPSVTTILKAYPKGVGFERYLANQESYESSREILKAAGSRGTNVHDATERLENGSILHRTEFTDEEWKMLMGFINFHKDLKPEIIMTEKSIVSDVLETGGTIDRVYKIDGEYVLLDFKTSKAIHNNYWLQVAVYHGLFMEQREALGLGHITPMRTAILRLAPGKKSGYELAYHDMSKIREDFDTFFSLYRIWKYDNPKAKPQFDTLPDTIDLGYNISNNSEAIITNNNLNQHYEETTITSGTQSEEDQLAQGDRIKRSVKKVKEVTKKPA
jgi:hypothetical protein